MKKKLTAFIVVIVLLAFCSVSGANQSLNLYINGSLVNSSTPPMVLNNTTMVPIRVVAENLNCDVSWSNGTVTINNKTSANYPTIEGTEEFKETIKNALSLAKENDINLYSLYTSNIDKIVLQGDLPAVNNADFFLQNVTVSISPKYFNDAKNYYSKDDLTVLFVGILAHEANHTLLYGNKTYTKDDVEAICNLAAVRAIEKIGGQKSPCYNIFKEDVRQQLKL